MTRLLLDTNVVIWLMTNQLSRIPAKLLSKIEQADKRYISAVSFAEVALKHRKFGAQFPFTTDHMCQALSDLQATELPLRREHAGVLSRIPVLHRDPFDHLLMAQAIHEKIELVATDAAILQYRSANL